MKWLILAFAAVLFTQAFGKRCDKNEECEDDQCCVKFFGWGPMAELGGLCQNLQDKDESCSAEVSVNGETPDSHFKVCPCKGELKCVNTRQLIFKGSISEYDPKCREPKSN